MLRPPKMRKPQRCALRWFARVKGFIAFTKHVLIAEGRLSNSGGVWASMKVYAAMLVVLHRSIR